MGDKVYALLGGGGYAEYVACDPRHALPIPGNLSFIAAASLPEMVFTVFTYAFEDGRLKGWRNPDCSRRHLGHREHTAIQMGKAAGTTVIATARGADKAKAALALGADVAVDMMKEDFAAIAKQAGGVDVVLDMVAGHYISGNLAALKPSGRIAYVASLGGTEITLPVFQLMQKRLTITGSTLRPRNADEKARLAAEVERVVWPWIATGEMKTKVDRTFHLAEAAKAHAWLKGSTYVGKVILTA